MTRRSEGLHGGAYFPTNYASATGGAAWTPASLGANLIAWYDANVGVYKDAGTTLAANNDLVVQWNDQSGNGYHLSQSIFNPPYLTTGFNSKPTIKIQSGVYAGLNTSVASVAMGTGSVGSMFVVCKIFTLTNQSGVVGYQGNGRSDTASFSDGASFVEATPTSNTVGTRRSASVQSFGTISTSTNCRLGSIFDGANDTFYINNVAQTTASNSSSWSSPGTVIVGMTSTGLGGLTDAVVSEIVLANSALSGTDQNNLDNYFKTKWGL